MSAWPVVVTAWCTAFSGFTALGLAMDRHHEDSCGRGTSPGTRRPWLHGAGALGLLLSLLACLTLKGPTQGWVLWAGMLTGSALAVVLMLGFFPRQAARTAAAAGALAALAAVAAITGN